MQKRNLLLALGLGIAAVATVSSLVSSVVGFFNPDGTYVPYQQNSVIKSATLSVDGDKGRLHVEYFNEAMDVNVKVLDRSWHGFDLIPDGPSGKFARLNFIRGEFPFSIWACPGCEHAEGPGPVGSAPMLWAKK